MERPAGLLDRERTIEGHNAKEVEGQVAGNRQLRALVAIDVNDHGTTGWREAGDAIITGIVRGVFEVEHLAGAQAVAVHQELHGVDADRQPGDAGELSVGDGGRQDGIFDARRCIGHHQQRKLDAGQSEAGSTVVELSGLVSLAVPVVIDFIVSVDPGEGSGHRPGDLQVLGTGEGLAHRGATVRIGQGEVAAGVFESEIPFQHHEAIHVDQQAAREAQQLALVAVHLERFGAGRTGDDFELSRLTGVGRVADGIDEIEDLVRAEAVLVDLYGQGTRDGEPLGETEVRGRDARLERRVIERPVADQQHGGVDRPEGLAAQGCRDVIRADSQVLDLVQLGRGPGSPIGILVGGVEGAGGLLDGEAALLRPCRPD